MRCGWWSVLEDVDAPWSPVYRAGWLERAEVHQAVGMIMVQLAVGSEDALARLRGYAAVVDRPVIDIAHAVISGRLRLGR